MVFAGASNAKANAAEGELSRSLGNPPEKAAATGTSSIRRLARLCDEETQAGGKCWREWSRKNLNGVAPGLHFIVLRELTRKRSQERRIAMTRATIPTPAVLVLKAQTAEELMTANPISLRADASIPEALALMTDRGFTAAPVIDEAGRPIGVLSRTDVLIHEREQIRHAVSDEDVHAEGRRPRLEGFSKEIVDSTHVRDIMTPTIFTVNENSSAAEVVKRMCELKVHQVFVVDDDDSLVGVISALDIVRSLAPAP
jgi:CBS-domain-containing membrane protein